MYFERTEIALSAIDSNQSQIFGTHLGEQVRAGRGDHVIAEIPFQPGVHHPSLINPLSIWQEVLGVPHVQLVQPEHPLRANVIVHETGVADGLGIDSAKRRLGQALIGALDDSLPGMTDRLHSYYIGPDPRSVDQDTEILEASDKQTVAQSVADICAQGLSFVISDFNSLPLGSLPSTYFPATVAVKVNHPAELALPANHGVVRLGGAREVNTNKPRELQAANQALDTYHQGVKLRLEQAGIAVAQVLFDPQKRTDNGIDVPAADQAIAQAIQRASAE